MPTTAGEPRVLVIGADGADPSLMERLMAAGQLPHLRDLRERGLYGRLRTTYPPVSPVAWTSLLTGCWPARHGVLDFVTKARGGYGPTIGLYDIIPGAQGGLQYRSRRAVATVADWLSEQGCSSYVLHVPGTFPPPQIQGGVLAGLGIPDLLGSFGVSALYTTDIEALAPAARCRPEVALLAPAGEETWNGVMFGQSRAQIPFTVSRYAQEVELRVTDVGSPIHLQAGDWSPWVEVAFPGARGQIKGICRFCLTQLDRSLVLYRTPLHHSPSSPSFPISWPAGFAPRLVSEVGLFPTASFPMDQAAHQDGLLSGEAFLKGAYQSWERQVAIAEHVMKTDDWDLLIMHLFTVDSLQHLFWPDITGRIAAGYRWLDGVVGRLHEAAGPDAVLIVASDHGVAPLERWVHLNVWLRQMGYLATDDQGRIDWGRTVAFCLGYGGIYLNVVGREPHGRVEPGTTYERLRAELIEKLGTLTEAEDGASVVEAALPREAWHSGPHVVDMPDVIVALRPGYGLGRQDAQGQAPRTEQVIEPNMGRWKGGHEGPYAPERVPGVLLAAGPGISPGRLREARIVDVAPTIMHWLGHRPPPGIDGRALAEATRTWHGPA